MRAVAPLPGHQQPSLDLLDCLGEPIALERDRSQVITRPQDNAGEVVFLSKGQRVPQHSGCLLEPMQVDQVYSARDEGVGECRPRLLELQGQQCLTEQGTSLLNPAAK